MIKEYGTASLQYVMSFGLLIKSWNMALSPMVAVWDWLRAPLLGDLFRVPRKGGDAKGRSKEQCCCSVHKAFLPR